MKKINIETRFIRIRIVAFILDLIAAGFVAWGQHYVLVVGIFLMSVAIVAIFYRCPNCGFRVDMRIKVLENNHCPNCGKTMLDKK